MKQAITGLALTAMLGGLPTAHANNLIDAKSPEVILDIAKGFGSAELSKDKVGDPKITGRIDGVAYTLFFYGCKNGRNCEDVQFEAGWAGNAPNLARINEWNRTKRYGNAYLDAEGDACLKMTANIQFGVTRRNVEDHFAWWKAVSTSFRKYIEPA